MTPPRSTLVLLPLLMCGLAACKSSGSDVPECRYENPAALAQSSWPKFRHDLRNSGFIDTVAVSAAPVCKWAFPSVANEACVSDPANPHKGVFVASPIISQGDSTSGPRLFIGSRDGTLYALNPDTGTPVDSTIFAFSTLPGISSTALAGQRAGQDAIFVGGDDGLLHGLTTNGFVQATFWPFVYSFAIASSPTLNGIDGTIYTGSSGGLFAAVCPNGAGRFGASFVGPISSSAAVGTGGTIYFGSSDGQLRAVESNGTSRWAFSTAAPLPNAPVVEVDNPSQPTTTLAIYVVDSLGHVYKIGTNGIPIAGFVGPNLPPVASSSPALAGEHLYVGADDGTLSAIRTDTGAIEWQFQANDAIRSSPAVASAGGLPVVIFGSDDGNLYLVEDDGATHGAPVTLSIGAAIRSSPAIGSDGTIYVGADDGRVYAFQ